MSTVDITLNATESSANINSHHYTDNSTEYDPDDVANNAAQYFTFMSAHLLTFSYSVCHTNITTYSFAKFVTI